MKPEMAIKGEAVTCPGPGCDQPGGEKADLRSFPTSAGSWSPRSQPSLVAGRCGLVSAFIQLYIEGLTPPRKPPPLERSPEVCPLRKQCDPAPESDWNMYHKPPLSGTPRQEPQPHLMPCSFSAPQNGDRGAEGNCRPQAAGRLWGTCLGVSQGY